MKALRRLLPPPRTALTSQVCSQRRCSGTDSDSGEARLEELLKTRFPTASAVRVQDISGGCGSMYEVWVESSDFQGLSRVKQHRLITEALAEQIKDMHGLRISTSVPES
ncbi:bolA-like protein 3 isoform X2 [Hyalella azteca]|uniref:BolA-like protein 3 isoform X2 n=1 Tax=Hyalella azteca TaxID=294128 RepID=A0A8B7P7Q8_HYAAZ|nr:bolA-like protein 3 isoform X2 [Hyalella azteca]